MSQTNYQRAFLGTLAETGNSRGENSFVNSCALVALRLRRKLLLQICLFCLRDEEGCSLRGCTDNHQIFRVLCAITQATRWVDKAACTPDVLSATSDTRVTMNTLPCARAHVHTCNFYWGCILSEVSCRLDVRCCMFAAVIRALSRSFRFTVAGLGGFPVPNLRRRVSSQILIPDIAIGARYGSYSKIHAHLEARKHRKELKRNI